MTKSKQAYPTDLNDTEWMQIAPYLPEPKTTGRPREISWREIMNGMFYMVKNGCVWRAMPHDLPAWQTVYYYFRRFQKASCGNNSIRLFEKVCVSKQVENRKPVL